MARKIRIPVNLVIEIDLDEYNAEYGEELDVAGLKNDIRYSALTTVQEAMAPSVEKNVSLIAAHR